MTAQLRHGASTTCGGHLRRNRAARLGVPLHVVEKCLNHTSGSFGGIVGVYQRHDFATERRDAMKVWTGHVASLMKAAPNNVVMLRRNADAS